MYTCTPCTRALHSKLKLQQSRHLASSIIAMPSVMFKDIGKACSGALAHASEAVRLKAKSCSVVARARFCADLLSKDYKTGKSTVELKTKTPAGLVRAAATKPAGEPPGNPNRASVCADAHAEWQQERQGRILRQPRAQVPGLSLIHI